MTEQHYINGTRAAWSAMLRKCLGELGYDSPEAAAARWAVEREEAVAALRSVCEDFGDNEWEPELSLADVVEKHLEQHLHERRRLENTVYIQEEG